MKELKLSYYSKVITEKTFCKAFYLLVILVLSSCSLTEGWSVLKSEDLTNVWTLSDVKTIGEKMDENSLLEEAMNNEQAETGYKISFFNDHKGFQIRNGVYKSFEWQFTEEEITLKFNNHSEKIKVLDYLKKDARTTLLLDFKEKGDYEFVKTDEMLSDIKNDPFYPENNEWRVKPKHLESNKELHNRVKNYIKHNALILKAAKERASNVISFEHSQGIVKIYRSAIGIIDEDEIAEEWYSYFYNDKQAIEAYYIYDEFLSANKYRGATTGEWVIDDYKILLSIYKDMELAKL